MNRIKISVLGTSEFKADPWALYARLRDESPVCRTRILGQRTWLVTRYDDVFAVLKDERFAKDYPSMLSTFNRIAGPSASHMLNKDAPDHTRLRTLVHKAFTPRFVARLEGRIQAVCDELLDAASAEGQVDLMRDYALPLPLTIIGEMLGMRDEDRSRFHALSRASLAASSTIDALLGVPNLWVITRHLRALIAERRAEPRDDLVTALIQAEEAGDRLSEEELVGMIFLLVLAGYETTVNLIGSGALALIEHPDQLERLMEDPDLAEPCIEELLRYVCPIDIASARFAREAIEVGSTIIPKGGMVATSICSANHDESQFPEPETLDIARTPNRHVAFGQGPHFCLGAPLARLEGRIALATLFERFKNVRLAVPTEALRWRKSLIVRGLEALPVSVSR